MDPRCDDYSSTNGDLLRPRAEVGDDCHLAVVASNCLADDGLSDAVLAVGRAKSLEELSAVRVRVWVTVRQIDFVIVVFELDLEGQRVVEATALLLQLVLEVANIGTISLPSIA